MPEATGRAAPLLILFSGPSGVGKDAILDRLRERGHRFTRPVTTTVRPPRESEVDGDHYHFVSEREFQRRLDRGELIEHALVYGSAYGLSRAALREALATGLDVILHVDVQGAATLRPLLPGALFIFVAPDSLETLEARLRERGVDATFDDRVATARAELARRDEFDHTLTNVDGDLDGTVEALIAILDRERARPGRQRTEL